MRSWFARLLRESNRQNAAPGARSRVAAPGVSVAATPSDAQPSTLADEDGHGLDLFVLNVDYFGDDGFYLGDDPIPPTDDQYAEGI